jgi:hypothetical protein
VTYAAADRAHHHDGVTQAALAARLAALQGYHFAGEYDPADRPRGRVYFVPGATTDTGALQFIEVTGQHSRRVPVTPYFTWRNSLNQLPNWFLFTMYSPSFGSKKCTWPPFDRYAASA